MKKENEIQEKVLACFTKEGVPEKTAEGLLKAASDSLVWFSEIDELSNIEVTSLEQTAEMKTAGHNRGIIKKGRLAALEFIKVKRTEVQNEMAAAKAIDTAWLRVSQFIETEAKEREAKLELAEKFKERYEAEQNRILAEKQLSELELVCDNPSDYPLPMKPDAFKSILESLKLAKDHKELLEKQAEEQRLKDEEDERLRLEKVANQAAIQKQRFDLIHPVSSFVPEGTDLMLLWELSDEAWDNLMLGAQDGARLKAVKDAENLASKQKIYRERVEEISKYVAGDAAKITFETLEEDFQSYLEIAKNTTAKQKEDENIQKYRIAELLAIGFVESEIEAVNLIPLGTTEKEWEELLEEIASTKDDSAPAITILTITPQQGNSDFTPIDPKATKGDVLVNWVQSFKIEPLHEEDLTEEQKPVYQDIFKRFDGFVAWASKETEKLVKS